MLAPNFSPRKQLRLLTTAALVLLGGWLQAQASAMPPGAGRIAALVPVDHVLRQQHSLEAARDMAVLWGDVVETSRGGRVRVQLDDGSVLNIGSASSMAIEQHDPAAQKTWLELTYGRVRASVTRITHPKGTFQIRTPTAVAGVMGTEEYVEASATQTTVIALGGGKVTARSIDPRFPDLVVLEPGEASTVLLGQPPTPKRPATADELRRAIEETSLDNLLGTARSLVRGTTIPAVLTSALDSKKNHAGDAVAARIANAVSSNGAVVLPKNTKLIGHVVEAQAKNKTSAESRLAVAFDRAVLKDGSEVPLRVVIQALAPPGIQPPSMLADEEAPGQGSAPMMRGASRPVSSSSDPLGAAGQVVGAASGTVASATPSVARPTVKLDQATGAAAQLPLAGPLPATSSGVLGLKDISLDAAASNAAGGSVFVSSTRTVRLESSTRILFRVVEPATAP